MPHTVTSLLCRFLSWVSRQVWPVSLIRASSRESPGLILIQIDGLSRKQVEKALEYRRIPYLKSLIGQSHRIISHYSGLPSSTPAVQGEIFYGVRCAVPAFGFCEKGSEEMTSMLNTDTALKVEKRLSALGRGLLEGGSAYSNVYTGGADRAGYCASRLGIGSGLRGTSIHARLGILLGYVFLLPRILILLAIEMVLALFDLAAGTTEKKHFWKEVSFVPSRVLICVLLRELTTAAVMLDSVRGLPVIHCNFLGYDEQSHRRGPSSSFAHWTLKGIDDAVARISETAARYGGRRYTLWIYSDHGQEATLSYEILTGKTVTRAVDEVLKTCNIGEFKTIGLQETVQVKRVGLLDHRPFIRTVHGRGRKHIPEVRVVAVGPIAHVYFPFPLDEKTRDLIARKLVATASIPLVVGKGRKADFAHAWNEHGCHRLPRDIGSVLNEHHPFPFETATDLVALAHHCDAGDLILCGMRQRGRPLTFPIENGAHAGPGPEETHGFIIVPQSALIPAKTRHLRPGQLREAILRTLDARRGV